MQFFIGLKEFTTQPVFDPSLFVDIRKRVGNEVFDSLNVELIKSVSEKGDKKHNKKGTDKTNKTPKNKGKMQADATVADQYYLSTDNGILRHTWITQRKKEKRGYPSEDDPKIIGMR